MSHGQSAESQSRPEASRGAVGAEHWSERGQHRIQPGSLNNYCAKMTRSQPGCGSSGEGWVPGWSW
ncbi:hypothetical protein D7024_12845 [Desulfofundulus salinus]|uniref:Uncharacterized protein n=1 Tax=Desulfofundulus salinus TaxID=2419843 RepID=A0A494X4W6_9FIRM|nr:hypothetical protein D7024_12845 [Desulfofundulus salinum]